VPDLDVLLSDNPLVALLVVIAVVLAGLLLILVGFVLIVAVEWLLTLIVLATGLTRLAWRKTWTVYARSSRSVVRRKAVGWAASKALIAQMAEEIERRGRPSHSTPE